MNLRIVERSCRGDLQEGIDTPIQVVTLVPLDYLLGDHSLSELGKAHY